MKALSNFLQAFSSFTVYKTKHDINVSNMQRLYVCANLSHAEKHSSVNWKEFEFTAHEALQICLDI